MSQTLQTLTAPGVTLNCPKMHASAPFLSFSRWEKNSSKPRWNMKCLRYLDGRRSFTSSSTSFTSALDGRFLALTHSHANDEECTVYIKGFMMKNEAPADFVKQLSAHRELRELGYGWGPRVYGYRWENNHFFNKMPLPIVSTASFCYSLLTRSKFLRFTPWTAAGFVVAELGMTGAQFLYNYMQSLAFIEEHAELLAKKLKRLTSHYRYTRIVAHSMGGTLLLSALGHIPDVASWPHEIHLLAPALTEEEFADTFAKASAANHSTAVYHCRDDWVLGFLYSLYHAGQPMGLVGSKSPNIRSVDASHHFENFVHNRYFETLPSFCVRFGGGGGDPRRP